jgi:hypothetical protein
MPGQKYDRDTVLVSMGCPTEAAKLARRPETEQAEMPEEVKKAME